MINDENRWDVALFIQPGFEEGRFFRADHNVIVNVGGKVHLDSSFEIGMDL